MSKKSGDRRVLTYLEAQIAEAERWFKFYPVTSVSRFRWEARRETWVETWEFVTGRAWETPR